MDLNDYIKKMPNLYRSVLDTVHVSENHPMYKKYVNDSIWKYMYGDEKVSELSTYINIDDLRVLDIGAGIGGISAAFAKKGANVTAIDVDEGYQYLSKIGYEELGVQVISQIYDGGELPFLSESFDVVCCFNIFEHVPDLFLLFREMERVLKQGGIVVGRADYCYNITNIKADPHYGIPGIILMPRWFRRWVVVDVMKRSKVLDDFTWAKNFKDICNHFGKVKMLTYPWNDDFIAIKSPTRNFEIGTGDINIERQQECFPYGWYRSELWGDEIVMWSKEKAAIQVIPLVDVKEISFELFSLENKRVIINNDVYFLKPGEWELIYVQSTEIKIKTTATKVKNDFRKLGVAIKKIKIMCP
ncbi:bifunctional 2-polyprenyl-6-hydroxyphenol methylase/3-demethylubiquinol 3-O-methyltransferase UbiG [Methanolobus sp.]|uniref:class I SAM-dependent methyltransferase n=1 Tax=Methanolobus sp. TaxID=1874737 RepID=UPI0025D6A1AC|nr:class I SAM-dependent methyltransferase [Methanolobus sp.]